MKIQLCALISSFFFSMSTTFATTIAFDGALFASDSQITYGTTKLEGGTKVFYSKRRHAYLGVSGHVVLLNKVEDWFLHSKEVICDVVAPKDSGMMYSYLLVNEDGTCFKHASFDGEVEDVEVHPPICIGSGQDFALSGMFLGLSAPQAILLASKLDVGTNDKIFFYDLKDEGNLHTFSLQEFLHENDPDSNKK